MRRFLAILGLLVLLSLFAFPLVTSAHPVNPTCSHDSCTGYRVHDTATCTNSLTRIETQVMYNHSGRAVGDFEFWVSNTCHAYYSTVYSYYGATEVHNVNVVLFGSDDSVTEVWLYSGQGAGVYADGKQIGHDPESINECYTPQVEWNDYSNNSRFNSFAQYCTTN